MTSTQPRRTRRREAALPVNRGTISSVMSSKVILVTPEMAAEWLNRNTHNRTLRDAKVEEFKEAILRGEWKYNGEPIRFSKEGTLLDGQHRLWAIMLAERAVECLVVTGLEEEVQVTIDTGTRRTLGDSLKLMGYPQAGTLAATINMKWKIDNGEVRTSTNPTFSQAIALFEKHEGLVEGVRLANRFRARLHGSAAAVGSLYYEFAQRDADAAEAFFEGLIEGVGLAKDSPILALRRQIETTKHSKIVFMALIIKAWNGYQEGRSMTNITWRPVGKNAEAFPEIKG